LSRLEIAVSGLYSLLLNRWADVAFLDLESEFTTTGFASHSARRKRGQPPHVVVPDVREFERAQLEPEAYSEVVLEERSRSA
jgi:hypothetical protein